MKKNRIKKMSLVALLSAAVLTLAIALVGCSAPANDSAADGENASGSESTAASIDITWQGSWFSMSEIVPPETETDKYELTVNADGSFTATDSGNALYSGVIAVTDTPEPGWGTATIDGKTIKVQLVNAQGVYKFIFNAGDDWDKSLKKIIFQR